MHRGNLAAEYFKTVMLRLQFFFLSIALCGVPLVGDAQDAPATREEVAELRALVRQLQARVDVLEHGATPVQPAPPPVPATVNAAPQLPLAATAAATPEPPASWNPTVNVGFDGYYAYNFNSPIGRANLLRAYDVSSNSFSINQANVIVESAPDPDHGKRFGARVDLQWGQATQTLQGNSLNEPRPEIYRALFQAYGTYVAPIGNGVTIDFGKWSSSIGIEGNYTKDQINYSRSYWFDYLPFYHMGLRMNYKVNDRFSVDYWVTNGTQQTEAYNGYKDQLFGFNAQPTKNVNWTVNYYLGQEHPDVVYFLNGGAPPDAPTQQGVPFEPIRPAPQGKLHIFDSYATWQVSPKWLLAGEADWVIERLQTNSTPSQTMGGATYARYQLLPKFSLAARTEYLNDRNGLYTGKAASLTEATLTAAYQFGEGFQLRWEWRRDMSNQPLFYTDTLGLFAKHQTTATVGMICWFGPKHGAW